MEDQCSVAGCENRRSDSMVNLEFYRFPLMDLYRLRRWIKYSNRGEDWKPFWNSVICSEHFDKTKCPKLPVRRKLDFQSSVDNQAIPSAPKPMDVVHVHVDQHARVPLKVKTDLNKPSGFVPYNNRIRI